MIGTMNALASTVLDIRRGATTSFQAGFEQLPKDEQVRILNDFEFLSTGTKAAQVETQGSYILSHSPLNP